jgi:hexulose-6-phosphate isomerase
VDSVHWHKTLGDPDEGVRAEGLEALQTAIRDCHAYGGGSVLLVPAVVSEGMSYEDAYKRSQEEIRKAIPLAEEMGVKISFENVWNNFLLSPLEAARYVDEFESPAVGFHFDVGNVVLYGWPEHWIRTLGHRITRLDIKEYSRSKLDNEGRWKGFEVEIGDGDCGWERVMQALRDIGYEGWAAAEVRGGDEARLTDIAQRMDRVFAM